jgi:hypothetical protein
MQVATKTPGETLEERRRRREAILHYGPIFAPQLHFSFDYKDVQNKSAETDREKSEVKRRATER